MDELQDTVIVGLGELLWDLFGDGRRAGGATANVAFHARLLGHRGMVCSRVGDDDMGRELCQYLRESGLDPSCIQVDPEHPTGTVTVDTARPNRPSYTIHTGVAWDFLEFTDSLRDLMTRAAAVCFGSLAQRSPASRQTIQQCLEAAADALVVFDVNLRQSWYDRQTLEASLERSDIAKLNIDEAGVLADLLGTAAKEPQGFAEEIRLRFGLEMVCITRAERGCLLVTEQETVDAPGVPVQVVDAVGSGDAFSAALISAHLRGWPVARAAAFANAVGALVASRPGAMPDLRRQYAKLIEQMV